MGSDVETTGVENIWRGEQVSTYLGSSQVLQTEEVVSAGQGLHGGTVRQWDSGTVNSRTVGQ